ncbi:MlaE family ABC transporter permease [Enhydrobacter aerosaccus]|uniref:MlaE family ABC transporter permease n=1 Tax=Enhydrobacter aerosaccus TaxID=225324 RepID=UPI001E434201|nr:ABC transporter permease [Enhydrobacter aerosaccus]
MQLTGDWIARETGVRSADEARSVVDKAQRSRRIRIDASAVVRWDSALIAFLGMIYHAASASKQSRAVPIDDSALPLPVRRLLSLAHIEARLEAKRSVVHSPFVTRAGEAVIRVWTEACSLVTLVGETAIGAGAAIVGRTRVRSTDILQLMQEAGARALLIVTIVNGLVGAILAFVGAVQLRRFGAEIYVADLVGIAMVREMAAVMTAIVMAGRTGGAYAAHLATMQGNEEIDALKSFGIPVFGFLVLPRIAALVAMMPLLYLYACVIGLAGGFVVGVLTLDLGPATFLIELQEGIAGRQFAIGLTKSIVFGAVVSLLGAHIGLRAGRSAAEVGRAATAAVVAGIIGIIALDAVFAVCTDALGL